jgi:esterase/lipase
MEKKKPVPSKLKWIQRMFQVGGNIAPSVMLPLFVKLAFTPKKVSLKPPHLDCLKDAEHLFLDTTEFRNPKKKIRVAYYVWGKGNKTILLVHGWDAKAVDYYKMIPVLVANGYRVVAFDGPGHGLSQGERSNLVDFKELMPKLIKKIGTPYAIVGHSMGGGASTYMLMEYEIKVERLVLLAIPIISKLYFDMAFNTLKIPGKMRKLFLHEAEVQLGEKMDYYNLIERKQNIKADKILLVYEEYDEEVPVAQIRQFLKSKPEIESVMVSGVGHNRVIKDKGITEKIVEFLK